MTGTTSLGFQHDKYSDGAVVDQRSFGFAFRYMYERTMGINVGINKQTKYNFTDRFGVLHTVPYKGIGWSISPYYRVAMNAAVEFAVGERFAAISDRWLVRVSLHLFGDQRSNGMTHPLRVRPGQPRAAFPCTFDPALWISA